MDYYLHNENFYKKIVADYLKYDRLLIGVDFDSTLKPWEDFEGKDCKDMCQLIRELKEELGCYIILWTANKYPEQCLEWCKENNVPIDIVNDNAPEGLEYFQQNGYAEIPKKVFFNYLLDNNAGLQQTYYAFKRLLIENRNVKIRK